MVGGGGAGGRGGRGGEVAEGAGRKKHLLLNDGTPHNKLFLFVDGIRVCYKVAKHERVVAIFSSGENVGLCCEEVGGSSLQTRNEEGYELDEAAVMWSNTPENQPAFAAVRVNSECVRVNSECAHQTHLYSPHVTSRHTLHHTLSQAPLHPISHALIARSSGKSWAYERNKAEHDAHWHTWVILDRYVANWWQRLLPMALYACFGRM